MAAHRNAGHHPVPGADLLDGEVDDDEVDTGQILEFGILQPHAGVEHLADDQNLTRPLGETAQRHVGGGQRHGGGFDRGDTE